MVNALVEAAIESGKIQQQSDITFANSSDIFDHSYPIMMMKLYDKEHLRRAEVTLNTLAQRLYVKKL